MLSKQRGFTLIEIMVVLGIVAALITVAAPRLINKDVNIKSVARNIAVLSKEIRNKARLTNSTYRLAIDMDSKEAKYWIEKANGPQAIDPQAYEKEKEKDKDEKAPPLFQMDKSLIKKEKTLPGKLRFGSVETINMKSPMTSGTAYVHFFPEGFVEAAAIQITDGNKLTWTLVFNPLTGQADIVDKAQSLKDAQR
ncbi:MAG: pilus assembly FimT family protein [Bdellovibrio sp.]